MSPAPPTTRPGPSSCAALDEIAHRTVAPSRRRPAVARASDPPSTGARDGERSTGALEIAASQPASPDARPVVGDYEGSPSTRQTAGPAARAARPPAVRRTSRTDRERCARSAVSAFEARRRAPPSGSADVAHVEHDRRRAAPGPERSAAGGSREENAGMAAATGDLVEQSGASDDPANFHQDFQAVQRGRQQRELLRCIETTMQVAQGGGRGCRRPEGRLRGSGRAAGQCASVSRPGRAGLRVAPVERDRTTAYNGSFVVMDILGPGGRRA